MRDVWSRLGGEVVYDAGVFRVRSDRYVFRGAPARHPFHVLEASDWVNVVAVTPRDEVVLVRQFRHGIQELSLEVPGGVIDATDAGPAEAAVRELREETGYAGREAELLGRVSSNPAILTNRTWSYLVRDAVPVADPAPDEHEALTVHLAPVAELDDLLAGGEIHHALSVCALAFFLRGPLACRA